MFRRLLHACPAPTHDHCAARPTRDDCAPCAKPTSYDRCATPTTHDYRAAWTPHDDCAPCARRTAYDHCATPTAHDRRPGPTSHDRLGARTTHDHRTTDGGARVRSSDAYDSQKRRDAERSKYRYRQTHCCLLVGGQGSKPHSKNLCLASRCGDSVQARFANLSRAFSKTFLASFYSQTNQNVP